MSCNGWTNYATWRVNLEMFNDIDPREYGWVNADGDNDASDLADVLRCYVDDYIEETSSEGLARDYALAFLADVDYHQIAENMINDYCPADRC